MTKEQKDIYQQRAKGTPQIKEEKYDTLGVPLSWKEKEEQRKRDMKKQVFQKIEDMISFLHNSDGITFLLYLNIKNNLSNILSFFIVLKHTSFHFGHFNYAVATDEQEFPPCEFAIIKYSLMSGIQRRCHHFVDPGRLLNLTYSIKNAIYS